MLDNRSTSLITAATLASRSEFKSELLEELRKIKETHAASRDELYEVFLQSYLFAGFPCALESLRSLGKVFGYAEPEIRSEQEIISAYQDYMEQGDQLYRKVYAGNADRVREEMLRLSPDLAAWAMIEGYGKTLSRPGLDLQSRELCIVSMLTQLGWERQLYSHILGANNIGANIDEIKEAVKIGAKGDVKKLEIAEQLVKKIV
jgi:4-carboxymuconolactone decarboxylase